MTKPIQYRGFEIRSMMAFYKVYENGKLRDVRGTEEGAKIWIDELLRTRMIEDAKENIASFRLTR